MTEIAIAGETVAVIATETVVEEEQVEVLTIATLVVTPISQISAVVLDAKKTAVTAIATTIVSVLGQPAMNAGSNLQKRTTILGVVGTTIKIADEAAPVLRLTGPFLRKEMSALSRSYLHQKAQESISANTTKSQFRPRVMKYHNLSHQ